MSCTSIDSEELITSVYKRRAIWDKRIKEHANRSYVEKCWKEIGREMNIEENKLRKKWKYLRDQFSTELSKIKPPRSGDEGGKTQTSKWQYFKSLCFLRDIMKPRPSSGNLTTFEERKDHEESQNSEINTETLDNDDENEDNIVGEEEVPDDADVQDSDDFVKENVTVRSVSALKADNPSLVPPTSTSEVARGKMLHVRKSQPLHTKIKRLRTDDYTTSMLDIEKKKLDLLTQKTEMRRTTDPEDEHLLFFKSLLTHVKKISPEKVFAFRGKVQQLVQEFAYPTNYIELQTLHSMGSAAPYSSSSESIVQSVAVPDNDYSFIEQTFNY